MTLAVSFFDRMTEYVSGEPWTYGLILGVSALDAFFPVVPSETLVITAGTLAAGGDLLIVLVIPAAALGAFLGDNVSYLLGDRIGEPIAQRLISPERLRWGQRMVDRHGATIIVAARFVPGGRTATTFAAGTLDLTWRRFAAYDAVAAVLWALYSGMVGYVGGAAFRDDVWKALLLSFGIAVALMALVEAWRRVQKHRGRDLFGDEERPA